MTELRTQEAHLREALTSRAVIDQAKGILMARRGLDADSAFAALVTYSQHSNIKLRKLAQELVDEVSGGSSRQLPASSTRRSAPSRPRQAGHS